MVDKSREYSSLLYTRRPHQGSENIVLSVAIDSAIHNLLYMTEYLLVRSCGRAEAGKCQITGGTLLMSRRARPCEGRTLHRAISGDTISVAAAHIPPTD